MAARIITLCDQLVLKVAAAWPGGVSAPDEARRAYAAPFPLDRATTTTGRHVWVFPAPYEDQAENRGEKNRAFEVNLIVAERYPDAMAAETDAARTWFDARVEFVEGIYDALDFGAGVDLLSFDGRELWTESSRCVTYDGEHLAGKKMFVSSIDLVLREVAAIE